MKIDLETIGINLGLALSGFFGSLLMKRKGKTWGEQLASILGGTASANYLTPLLIEWLDLTTAAQYSAAFLIGFGGLRTIEILYERLIVKTPYNGQTPS